MEFIGHWLALIWGYITAFDFSPPRTPDQLAGWGAFLIAITGVLRWVWKLVRRWVTYMVKERLPYSYFLLSMRNIEITNRYIDRLEQEGYFDPKTRTLVLAALIWQCFVYIVLGAGLLLAISGSWPEAFRNVGWAMLGASLHLMSTASEYADLAKAIRGSKTATLRNIRFAEQFLADIPHDFEIKDQRMKKLVDELRGSVPALKQRLEKLRDGH